LPFPRKWAIFRPACGNLPGKGGIQVPLVIVKDNESPEKALRRFKRKCEKAGILSEIKRRRFFEKPSVKRKRKERQARKKALKRLAKEARYN